MRRKAAEVVSLSWLGLTVSVRPASPSGTRHVPIDPSPFKLPRRNLLQVQVGAAQAFLVEAERRQAQFVAIGLPPTFISDYRVLVDELTQAFHGRLNSKTVRATARAGIATAIQQGPEIVRDLEVLVEIATGQDPILTAAWRVARTIEGQKPRQKNAEPDAASPSASPESTAGNPTLVEAPAPALEKAS